ncbi:MAG: hypothetical protein KIC77_09305 [Clostridiales bacterium]|jgi:hypothetical protein|nr:hypothetical protein [Clostridiales bacterium]
MIILMNLFFVPMITMYIYYSRKKKKLEFTFSFFVKYCIVTVLVFLFAKIFSQFVNVFYPLALPLDRASYTLFAVPAAIVLPFAIEFIQKYFRFKIKVESNKHEAE